jgi:AsmA protein
MGKKSRLTLITVAVIIVLILIAIAVIPLFINADSFRNRIEATLSQSLGRKVEIGKLNLSIWSGSLVANNATIADDPKFSSQPFVQADSVKIGVEVLPLIFHHELHVRGFVLESPKIHLIRAENGTWNYSSLGGGAGKAATPAERPQLLSNLTVDRLNVKNGSITISELPAGSTPERVYSDVNAELTDFRPNGVSPFSITAQLPGGGTLDIKGKVGPFNASNSADTPLDAQVSLKNASLEKSGIFPADAGIAGTADADAHVQSDGQTLSATGTGNVAGIKLAKDGQPPSKPLRVKFGLSENEAAKTGKIENTTLSVGRAVINLAGTFHPQKPSTALDLKLTGNAVPVDDLEAFLPALGIHLPKGSQLEGGTLTSSLAVTGTTATPAIRGPVRLANARLAGFNLGSKLQALSQLTGGKIGNATGSTTTIRSLSMNVAASQGAIRTDNIALDVAGLGTATGAGTVSPSGALNYDMLLKLTGLIAASSNGGGAGGIVGGVAGMIQGQSGANAESIAAEVLRNGVPVTIGGTTSNPTFGVDLQALAARARKNAVKNLLNQRLGNSRGKQAPENPLSKALGNILGRH